MSWGVAPPPPPPPPPAPSPPEPPPLPFRPFRRGPCLSPNMLVCSGILGQVSSNPVDLSTPGIGSISLLPSPRQHGALRGGVRRRGDGPSPTLPLRIPKSCASFRTCCSSLWRRHSHRRTRS